MKVSKVSQPESVMGLPQWKVEMKHVSIVGVGVAVHKRPETGPFPAEIEKGLLLSRIIPNSFPFKGKSHIKRTKTTLGKGLARKPRESQASGLLCYKMRGKHLVAIHTYQ